MDITALKEVKEGKELFEKQAADAEATNKAIAAMTAVATRTDLDEVEYAKLFIAAQYEVVMCLVEEKVNLTALVRTLSEVIASPNFQLVQESEDQPSFQMPESPTLH